MFIIQNINSDVWNFIVFFHLSGIDELNYGQKVIKSLLKAKNSVQ